MNTIPDFKEIKIDKRRIAWMLQILTDFFYKQWINISSDDSPKVLSLKYDDGVNKIIISNNFLKLEIQLWVNDIVSVFRPMQSLFEGVTVTIDSILYNNKKVTLPYKFAKLLIYFDDNGIFNDAVSYFEKQALAPEYI